MPGLMRRPRSTHGRFRTYLGRPLVKAQPLALHPVPGVVKQHVACDEDSYRILSQSTRSGVPVVLTKDPTNMHLSCGDVWPGTVVSRSSRPGAGLLDGFGGKIRRIRWKFPEDYQDPYWDPE